MGGMTDTLWQDYLRAGSRREQDQALRAIRYAVERVGAGALYQPAMNLHHAAKASRTASCHQW